MTNPPRTQRAAALFVVAGGMLAIVVAACGTPTPADTAERSGPATTPVPLARGTGPRPDGRATATTGTAPPATASMTLDTAPVDPNRVVGTGDQPDEASPPTTRVWPACPDTAGQLTHATLSSQVMRNVHPTEGYWVYTPPCYARDAERRYPVIYLLHGANTDESQWIDVGVADTANRLIAAGQIPPVIIVSADGIYAMGDYEAPAGQLQPFDFFLLYELKPQVQRGYRTLNHRDFRAVGGISRGGEWALLVAGRHPDVFGAVGGHSPAVGSPTNPGPVLAPQLAGKGLRIWLDVGAGDSLAGPVGSLDASLRSLGVPHEYHQGPGGHDRAYWRANTEAYLRWYTAPWGGRAAASAPGTGGGT